MTKIPVKIIENEEVLSVDINWYCNHAGAVTELIEYDSPTFWADAGRYVNDDSELVETLTCYACGYEELIEKEDFYFD